MKSVFFIYLIFFKDFGVGGGVGEGKGGGFWGENLMIWEGGVRKREDGERYYSAWEDEAGWGFYQGVY